MMNDDDEKKGRRREVGINCPFAPLPHKYIYGSFIAANAKRFITLYPETTMIGLHSVDGHALRDQPPSTSFSSKFGIRL